MIGLEVDAGDMYLELCLERSLTTIASSSSYTIPCSSQFHLKFTKNTYGNPLIHTRITHLGVKPLCSQ
jgi:hypothetical protein